MGWSDYTTENNTSCTNIYNMIHCLQLAYNERAILGQNSNVFTETERFDSNPQNFCQLFDAYLPSLVNCFAYVKDGVFTPYTITNIYEELGEERLDSNLPPFKGNNLYYKKWFEQIIRVLNKLIYTTGNIVSFGYSGDYAQSGTGSIYSDIEDAIDDAIARVVTYNTATITSASHFTKLLPASNNNWYGQATSTNFTMKILGTNLLKNRAFESSIVFVDCAPFGLFDGGEYGYIEGLNLIFDNASLSFDNDGLAILANIPGESLNNFPKYPSAENFGIGYQLAGGYILITDFEFVEGS